MDYDDIARASTRISAALHASSDDSRYISKLILLLGLPAVDALLGRAMMSASDTAEAADPDGPLVRDMFFALAVAKLNRAQHLIVFGPTGWQDANIQSPVVPPPPVRRQRATQSAPSSADLRAALAELGDQHGTVQQVSATLVGRPVRARLAGDTVVALMLDSETVMGENEAPLQRQQYVVYIPVKVWNRVVPKAYHQAKLSVSGWACYDPAVQHMVLYAQHVHLAQSGTLSTR